MPIYDLFCSECEFEEEYLSPTMTFTIERQCPNCNIDLKKKMGSVPVIFKGSGFYATEHGKSKGNSYKKDKSEIEEREKFVEQAKKDAP